MWLNTPLGVSIRARVNNSAYKSSIAAAVMLSEHGLLEREPKLERGDVSPSFF